MADSYSRAAKRANRVQSGWARGGGGGRGRGGGGQETRGKVYDKGEGEEHYLSVHLTKVDPGADLKLKHWELSALCLDILKIPKAWLTGVNQTMAELSVVKIRSRNDLQAYNVREIVVRPGEIVGSTLEAREKATWVYFYGGDLAMEPGCVTRALQNFGEFTTDVQEYLTPNREGRLADIWTGDLRVGMVVKRPIPQFIFIETNVGYAQQIKVVYGHQKKKCGWCGKGRYCHAGKNFGRCKEMGTKRADRQVTWSRHHAWARAGTPWEDSDVEDEDTEDDFDTEEEEEHSGSETSSSGDDGEEEVTGENNERPAGEGAGEARAQAEAVEAAEVAAEVAEEVAMEEEVVAAPQPAVEPAANGKKGAKDISPRSKQEKTEENQKQKNVEKAKLSDMVQLPNVPVHAEPKDVLDLLEAVLGEDAEPQVVQNPNPTKARCWIVKNLTEEQRLQLYATPALRRMQVPGGGGPTKIRATAYTAEDALEDFPADITTMGKSDITAQLPPTVARQSTVDPSRRKRKKENSVLEGPSISPIKSPEQEKEVKEAERGHEGEGGETDAGPAVAGERVEEVEEIRNEEQEEQDEDEQDAFMEGDGLGDVREVEAQSKLKTKGQGGNPDLDPSPFAKNSKIGHSPVKKPPQKKVKGSSLST